MSSYEIFGRQVLDEVDSVAPPAATIQSEPGASYVLDVPFTGGDRSHQWLAIVAAYEAALAIASEVEIDTVLQRIVELSRTVVNARLAVLSLPDPQGRAHKTYTSHTPMATHPVCPSPEDCDLIARALCDEQSHRVDNVHTDPEFEALRPKDCEINAFLVVPISWQGEVRGRLMLANPMHDGAFTTVDEGALRLLSSHAAAAIDRAWTFGAVAESHQQVEQQVDQLQAIMNNMPAGVLLVNPPDAWVQLANSTALGMILGPGHPDYSVPVVYRDFHWQTADGSDLARDLHPGMRALRGETMENGQLILVNKQGVRLPVLVQSAPVRVKSGAVLGAVIVFQDITRIREADQIKDDFLSLISHEFRTPLTAIHGGALLLQQQGEELDLETRHELLEDIGEESARLDRMLGNLLSVSEIMAGRFQASTEPILMEPVVSNLVESARSQSQIHEFTIVSERNVPPAEGDPELFLQILRNLYENAIKYAPDGGKIETRICRVGDWIQVSVIDEGLGILPEHVTHVFERFRRPGADPTVRGMGLGLYLSRLLIDAQGGRIRASSDGPGKGSTFVVELPVVREWETDDDLPPAMQGVS